MKQLACHTCLACCAHVHSMHFNCSEDFQMRCRTSAAAVRPPKGLGQLSLSDQSKAVVDLPHALIRSAVSRSEDGHQEQNSCQLRLFLPRCTFSATPFRVADCLLGEPRTKGDKLCATSSLPPHCSKRMMKHLIVCISQSFLVSLGVITVDGANLTRPFIPYTSSCYLYLSIARS